MRDVYPDIEARGAQVVVVGNGQPDHARDFQDEHRLPFTLLTDPDLKAYAAAGMRRGLLTTMRPRAMKNALRAWKGGFRQKSVQGDPWQQGGVFVLGPDARELFCHISGEAGDHPAPAQILAALPQAA